MDKKFMTAISEEELTNVVGGQEVLEMYSSGQVASENAILKSIMAKRALRAVTGKVGQLMSDTTPYGTVVAKRDYQSTPVGAVGMYSAQNRDAILK